MLEVDEYKKISKSVCFHFAQQIEKLKKQGVRFYFIRLPIVNDLKNFSELEKKIVEKNINGDNVLELLTKKELEQVMQCPYSKEYVHGIFRSFEPIVRKNGVLVHSDSSHPDFNVINGCRMTVGQLVKFENTIYLFGKSQCLGIGVKDQDTIASYLQSLYKEEYRVENHGVGGVNYEEILRHVQFRQYKKGDIVIVLQHIEDFVNDCYAEIGVYIDNGLFPVLDRPHNMGEIFFDKYHFNQIACSQIAKYIKYIIDENIDKHSVNQGMICRAIEENKNITYHNDEILNSVEFRKYIDSIREICGELKGVIGSIVMNCNPFTYGHRYLIENALEEVDSLLIFVVEENSSFFPFDQRYEMVRLGCADLKNVFVVPSGTFIISAQTFPQYFIKDILKDVKIDPSKDVEIFGKGIVPQFNIKKRFVGNEPFDYITKQYNSALKRLLPQYGVECIVIERKEIAGNAISASLVRQYMEEDELDKLNDLVPATTLAFCKKTMDKNKQ